MPHLLLPSIFPSIMVFSNELALHIRWLGQYFEYWSFSVSPSNEYSGLISFSDLRAVQRTLNRWVPLEMLHSGHSPLPSPHNPRFWHHQVTHSPSKHGDWDEGINCLGISKPLPWSLLTIEKMRRSLVLKEVARDCRPGGIKRKTRFPKREEVTSKKG